MYEKDKIFLHYFPAIWNLPTTVQDRFYKTIDIYVSTYQSNTLQLFVKNKDNGINTGKAEGDGR